MMDKVCDWIEQNYLKATLIILAVLAALAGLTFAVVARAGPASPTGTFTATPSSGTSPLTFTLTWTTTGAATCTGSGAWNGAKALSGSQAITGLTATANYILTCPAAGGWADVSWTPPTQNTDGSALTNLASYKLFYATTPAGVPAAVPVSIPAPTSAYGVTGLAAGAWSFGMEACNSSAVCSVMSGLASKTVVVPSWSANVTVTITTQPNPPTAVVAVQTLVYELQENPAQGTRLGRMVGAVPLGTVCGETTIVESWGAEFHSVPLASVILSKQPKSSVVVAECAAAPTVG